MKQGMTLPSSLLIDPTAESLDVILAPYRGITHVPSDLSGQGLMVFIELQKCFKKADRVCEGLLGNVYWGFEQCGYDPRHVAAGLTDLREKGYIFYSDGSRARLSELLMIDHKKPIWLRYTQKMMDLFVRGEQ